MLFRNTAIVTFVALLVAGCGEVVSIDANRDGGVADDGAARRSFQAPVRGPEFAPNPWRTVSPAHSIEDIATPDTVIPELARPT